MADNDERRPRQIVSTTVTVDGKPIDPASAPAWLQDKNGNGIPDVLDDLVARAGTTDAIQVSRQITINGKSYASVEDVPDPMRETVRRLMGNLPGVEEKREVPREVAAVPSSLESAWAADLLPSRPPTARRRGNTWLILLAAAAGAALTYLLMR
jgi:hypothetical protein